MKKIPHKITIEINKTTVIFALIFLALGYFIGNTLPIVGGYQIPSSQTTITTGGSAGGQTQPSKIALSPDNDPTIGDTNAPVQFYEFSDFQCPFCRRFYTESLSQLENEYVKTGKVLFVYKDFPLDQIHPGATPAAMGAECARDQNKWREIHNKIFDEQNKQGGGTIDFSVDDVKQWASEIGLDTTTFNQCLDSNKYLEEVQKDFQEGVNAGVGGTPTFFIGNSQKGFTSIVGAQPYSVLKQAIEQQLS